LTLKHLKGRGLVVEQTREDWLYDLEGDVALNGFLFVEGWKESKFMQDWYEKNKDNLIQANISNYDLTMQLLGIEYDESGHYSSSRIKVKAKCAT
jgi:hypothetical protein